MADITTSNDAIESAEAARDELRATEHARDRPTDEEIAAEAYAIYIAHGRHGQDVEDWLEAERRLRAGRRAG